MFAKSHLGAGLVLTLVCLAGGVWVDDRQSSLPSPAEALLFFPQARSASSERDPLSWAQEALASRELTDRVCHRLEQRGEREAVGSAATLLAEGRLHSTGAGEGLLTVQVDDANPERAVLLCQTVLSELRSALNSRRDKAIEEQAGAGRPEEPGTLEEAEGELVRSVLHQQLHPKPKNSDHGFLLGGDPVESRLRDLSERVSQGVGERRRSIAAFQKARLQVTREAPDFTVVDPPALAAAEPSHRGAWVGVMGALCLWLCAALLLPRRAS